MGGRASAALCCVALCCATGCGQAAGSAAETTGAATPSAPQPERATAVAQREYGDLSGGGWGAAWDLWTPAAQRTITRAGYVHVNTVCPPGLGVPYVVTGSRAVDATTVTVTYRHHGGTGTNTLRYLSGRWRFVPDPALLHRLRRGPDDAIAARKAAGSCGHR